MADPKHGVAVSLHIGQRVRHRDHTGKRVTGIVNSLQVESEQGLTASVILDEPIIIPARGEGDREIRINWQTCPVTEFAPFDDRDELIAEIRAALLGVLPSALVMINENDPAMKRVRAVLDKTRGIGS